MIGWSDRKRPEISRNFVSFFSFKKGEMLRNWMTLKGGIMSRSGGGQLMRDISSKASGGGEDRKCS